MENDGKLYIVITDNPNGVGNGNKTPNEDVTEDETSIEKFIQHQFFSFMSQTAKKIVNTSISNIGNFTGDYYAQREAQTVVEWVSRGLTLVGSGIAGAKLTGGNIYGILTAVGIAGASMMISDTLSYVSEAQTRRRENREIERLREISGLNVLTNGSR